MGHHTVSREVGAIFARTRPQARGLLAHRPPLQRPDTTRTVERLIAETRKKYDRPLEIGEDLTTSKSLILYASSDGLRSLLMVRIVAQLPVRSLPRKQPCRPFPSGMQGGVARLAIPAGYVLVDKLV